jgi:hypothetical protein
MDKVNAKMWALLLVTAMITSTFVGFSVLAWGPTNPGVGPYECFTRRVELRDGFI